MGVKKIKKNQTFWMNEHYNDDTYLIKYNRRRRMCVTVVPVGNFFIGNLHQGKVYK